MPGPAAPRLHAPAPAGPLDRARSALAAASVVTAALAGLVALAALQGCMALDLPDGEDFAKLNPLYEPDTSKIEKEWGELADTDVTVNVKYVGQYVSVTGRNAVVASGVGLVTGLKNTGGNPVPGELRTRLLDDMKTRGVTGGAGALAWKTTALVRVRAYIPPLVNKNEPVDVEVLIPPGANATDLTGGWLLDCDLSEGANVGGSFKAGKDLASAFGPVLVRPSDDAASRRASVSRGKVLGGGVAKIDRALEMRMHHRFKGSRWIQKVTKAVGRRFHHRGPGGVEESVAKAHTDVKITLDVPDIYREDYPRFLRVVDNIAMKESPVARRLRIKSLEKELNEGRTAELAAIRLEAIGEEAVPTLKRALGSEDEEVRFHAGIALAYLGSAEGLEDLRTAAADEPAFRVYALAALTAAGGPQAATELRALLADPVPETRYGAFRALWTVAPDDPYLNHTPMRATDPATGLKTGPTLFHLHPVRVDGGTLADDGATEKEAAPPLVHINHNRRAEVVLFGPDQRFLTPLTVRAGRLLIGCPPKGETVTISRIEPGREDTRECGTEIADVIAACVELGAEYPDIAGMLQEAAAQHNLPGELEIDALPVGGRIYRRKAGGSAPVGAGGLTPNLYRGSAAPKDPNAVDRYADAAGDEPAEPAAPAADESAGDTGESEEESETPADSPADAAAESEASGPGMGAKFKALFGGGADADDWGGDVE